MIEIKEIIKQAILLREQGHVDKAIKVLLSLLEEKLSYNQQVDLYGNLGLCYFHKQDYKTAKSYFQKLLEISEIEGDYSNQALAYRQLSRPELYEEKDQQVSIDLSKKAYEMAIGAKRGDLPWFSHGVISILIRWKQPRDEINRWFGIMSQDLNNLPVKDREQDRLPFYSWLTGMLIDRYLFNGDPFDLTLAEALARQNNLQIRLQQIEELKKF